MYREAVVQFLNQFIGFGDDAGRRSEVMNGMLGFAQHVGASSLESYVSYDTIAAAAACKVPILYISAGFGFADLARFKELTPQLMVAQTVGSGHYHQLEVPDQVNAMIERFIAVSGGDAR
jgi:pimeloyl-ACP methyl ester carboxylesterase